jgi:hypothetical protein
MDKLRIRWHTTLHATNVRYGTVFPSSMLPTRIKLQFARQVWAGWERVMS